MESNPVNSIAEAFQKEIERYQLDKIGFIGNPREEIIFFIDHYVTKAEARKAVNPELFRQWRQALFSAYYRQKGFAAFVKSHVHQPAFRRMVYKLMIYLLNQRQASEPAKTDTDKYLAPPGKTFSWLLSEEEFIRLYALHFHEHVETDNTEQLTAYCRNIIQIFPHETRDILAFLADDNKECWENMSVHLKNLTESVTKAVFRLYRDDTSHDIWTRTYEALRKALQNGKLPLEANAQEVNAFTRKIIRNQIYVFFRTKQKDPLVLIDNWEEDPSLQNNEGEDHKMQNDSTTKGVPELTDMDPEDEDGVRHALARALLNKDNPIRKQLPEGVEDKLKTLIAQGVEDLSYEEIALEKVGRTSPEKLKREAARLRQDVSRVKIKIKELFRKSSDSDQ